MTIKELMYLFMDGDSQYLQIYNLDSNLYVFQGMYEEIKLTKLADAEILSIDNIYPDSNNVQERTLTINISLYKGGKL